MKKYLWMSSVAVVIGALTANYFMLQNFGDRLWDVLFKDNFTCKLCFLIINQVTLQVFFLDFFS